jgi:hypothetical protein
MSDTISSLKKKINELEKKVDQGREEDRLRVLEIEKEDVLNAQMKSYENNVKIVGWDYDMKEAQKKDEESKNKWRLKVLQSLLIDTKLVKSHLLIRSNKLISGVLRDAHPLSGKKNAPIVIAFTESWLANQIKDKAKNPKNLQMGKLKIHAHLPPIIDALKNEALRERKRMLEEDGVHKIICVTPFKKPWVSLFKIIDDKKVPLNFTVEDGRLHNPAKTLAQIALDGGNKFVPLKFLSNEEREAVPKNVLVEVASNPTTAMDVGE